MNVKDIWKDEAKDFTKWLYKNIDYLNDKIGFTINVIETEHQIGSFRVDIFGEDEQGNSVIIENQLEKTDHDHLGKLLTYSVGAAAKTIIWISPSPREEHAEVIEWLNEMTPVDMRWYLIKVEAIRIGNSPVSPLFTAVVAPSQEIKAIGSEKKELAERHIKRIEFWQGLLPVLNGKTSLYKNVSPTKDNWLNAGTGFGGVFYQIVIRMDSASILLVIERGSSETNKKVFDYLYQHKEKIEKEFGEAINWRRMDDQISCRIQYDIPNCGLKDKNTWDKGFEVVLEKLIIWDKVFINYIKQLKNQAFD